VQRSRPGSAVAIRTALVEKVPRSAIARRCASVTPATSSLLDDVEPRAASYDRSLCSEVETAGGAGE
jgi:hypothetical protein